MSTPPQKARIATIWLDGCSGCHMSFLDIDHRLLEIADRIDLVYGPLVDQKEFPENVDVTIVEGAVTNEEDEHKIRLVRERSKLVVALGDCAVTGNVPSMRNSFSLDSLYSRAYVENVAEQPAIPQEDVPPLLARTRPLHEVVSIDLYVPGCPPHPDHIFSVLGDLLDGRIPHLGTIVRFG
ncbi:MAG: NADP oxidoreductase [Candidatus Hydrogenedentota bacterium]